MNTYPLDQASALYLSAIATRHEDDAPAAPMVETEIVSVARFALPRHCLASALPRAPRHHWQDDEQGESVLDGDEDDESARHYAPHVLPSRRTRGDVFAELRGMGVSFAD